MHIDEKHLLRTARAGVKLAFNRSRHAEAEHFDEWIQRHMEAGRGTAMELYLIVNQTCLTDMSDEECRAISIAREFLDLAVSLEIEPSFDQIIPVWEMEAKDYSPHLSCPLTHDLETES